MAAFAKQKRWTCADNRSSMQWLGIEPLMRNQRPTLRGFAVSTPLRVLLDRRRETWPCGTGAGVEQLPADLTGLLCSSGWGEGSGRGGVVLVAGAGAFVEGVAEDVNVGLFGEALGEAVGEAVGALAPGVDDGVVGVDGHGRRSIDHLRNVAADDTLFAGMPLIGLHGALTVIEWPARAGLH